MNKREVCPRCEFIVSRCLCESLRSIDNRTHLIILQHSSETDHALNTVALMKKSYQKFTLLIGEDFSDNSELNSLIQDKSNHVALLYPKDNSSLLTKGNSQAITHLILIDGTWKKANKIFRLSKNLQALPSFKLEVKNPSLYQIRQSQMEHSLSTLEASTHALELIEETCDTSSLVLSFKRMIEFQIEKMGRDLFEKNYLKKKEGED